MGHCSNQHEEVVEIISIKYGLKRVTTRPSSLHPNQYFPDLTHSKYDIEVEMIPENHKLEKKIKKWDNGKKKILVLRVNQRTLEEFEYIFIYGNGRIVRIY